MLLKDKIAVIYGGGGAIGGAVARTFAREGARVFLAGRTRSKLDSVAAAITSAGGSAEVAEVDALNESAIDQHADDVVAKTGRIDIALNAVGVMHVQGTPFTELSLADYAHPIRVYTQTNFLTAKAVARHMMKQGDNAAEERVIKDPFDRMARQIVKPGSGVILTLSTPGSRLAGPGFMGFGGACAAIEALSRHLSGELGPSGIRIICLRPDAIPEALATSHSREVFAAVAKRAGVTIEAMLAGHAQAGTLLKRLPTLAEIAEFAAFVASDRAGAMTGAIVNLTCGSLVD